MAIRPDYMVGTITLTSGSKNFTTAGASLQSANVTGGDTIMTADGRVLIIDKVTGQNAGTLRNNSPISASNVALVIRYQPDGSKYQGAMRDLLERWGLTGNIDAIAGLETAKDMLAYFTGSGTADVTALTEWARTLLAAADGGKGYEALGEVPSGSFPGRLKNTGGYIANPNGITDSGWYRTDAGNPNMPENATMLIFHLAFSGTQARQIAFRHSSNAIYERCNVGGTWSSWFRMYSANNLLSTVSQASGVPTGGVIQSGSNSNGNFMRLADGTQYCWSDNLITGGGSTYSSTAIWVLPASFSNRSYSGFSIARSVNPSSADAMRDSQSFFEDVNASQARVGVISSGKLIAGGTIAMRAFAVGRWFNV